ncbi:unnamed protein product [Amoebophrya sp. A25]|nr:unnamed protein product [Amoebophrya sp. A25]|eukprot:GSA25T00018425001.1
MWCDFGMQLLTLWITTLLAREFAGAAFRARLMAARRL